MNWPRSVFLKRARAYRLWGWPVCWHATASPRMAKRPKTIIPLASAGAACTPLPRQAPVAAAAGGHAGSGGHRCTDIEFSGFAQEAECADPIREISANWFVPMAIFAIRPSSDSPREHKHAFHKGRPGSDIGPLLPAVAWRLPVRLCWPVSCKTSFGC